MFEIYQVILVTPNGANLLRGYQQRVLAFQREWAKRYAGGLEAIDSAGRLVGLRPNV